MKADVQTLGAKKAGSVELSDLVFGLEPREDLLHRMVRYQLAKRQRGTHRTKPRGDVSGSTRKIIRQKGTGGARHGSRKVPQFRGGGKAFGPVVRSHATELPKKVRRLAMRTALSAKQRDGDLIVLDEAKSGDPKTKALATRFAKLGWSSALIVDSELDRNFRLAARNIPHIDVLPSSGANVLDIMRRGKLVLTKLAVEQLQERLR